MNIPILSMYALVVKIFRQFLSSQLIKVSLQMKCLKERLFCIEKSNVYFIRETDIKMYKIQSIKAKMQANVLNNSFHVKLCYC